MLERKRNLTNNAIDFVITWVNGNDPEWRKEKSLYSGDAISNSFELDIREDRKSAIETGIICNIGFVG